MQIYEVKQKIPFKVFFLKYLAVFVDERTAGVDYLEVGNVTEKQKHINIKYLFHDAISQFIKKSCI